MAFYAVLAFLPILLALVLMIGFKFSSIKAMPIAMLTGAFLAFFVWELELLRIVALAIQGFITATGVIIIIFGALLLYYCLLASGAMETIQAGMQKITPDRRLQAVIIGFMFSAFLEGAAGFGTPAALSAALLFGLGFPPLCAAIIALAFNSVPVTFGVVGTPTFQGFKSIEAIGMQALNTTDPSLFYLYLAHNSALMHLPMLFILPIFMLGFMTRYFGKNRSWKEGFSAWKYCIMASFCFGIPFLSVAWLSGPELPSLIGALFGLGSLIFLTKKGICVPKEVWLFDIKENWEKEWSGKDQVQEIKEFKEHMSQFKAWLPYILCGVFLVLTRLPIFGLKPIFTDPMFSLGLRNILGFEGISSSIALLNSPGILPFMLVSLITIFYHNMLQDDEIGKNKVSIAWATTCKKIIPPAITLLSAVGLVSIFRGTDATKVILDIAGNGVSMPMAMALTMAELTGKAWVYYSPFLAGVGTFITGSSTISNMLFANFQWDIAVTLEYELMQRFVVVATQGVGGAMGCIISINGMVSVCTVLGMVGHEGAILRRTIWPFLLYGISISMVSALLL